MYPSRVHSAAAVLSLAASRYGATYREIERLVIPYGTTSGIDQLGVEATSSLRGTRVVPDLLLMRANERDGKAHTIGSAHSAYSMNVHLGSVGKSKVCAKARKSSECHSGRYRCFGALLATY